MVFLIQLSVKLNLPTYGSNCHHVKAFPNRLNKQHLLMDAIKQIFSTYLEVQLNISEAIIKKLTRYLK